MNPDANHWLGRGGATVGTVFIGAVSIVYNARLFMYEVKKEHGRVTVKAALNHIGVPSAGTVMNFALLVFMIRNYRLERRGLPKVYPQLRPLARYLSPFAHRVARHMASDYPSYVNVLTCILLTIKNTAILLKTQREYNAYYDHPRIWTEGPSRRKLQVERFRVATNAWLVVTTVFLAAYDIWMHFQERRRTKQEEARMRGRGTESRPHSE